MTRAAVTTVETRTQRTVPRWPSVLVVVAALVLVASSWFLPLWNSHLRAPQYPGGLELIAYGNRAEGDLAEIDGLNHYIGMKPFRVDDFPEVALWPLGVATALAAVLVGVLWRDRWWGRLARLFLWVLPISILVIIQIRLYQYGHDLDPGAAFRMDGFTPKVIGPTKVWNFTAMSMPGTGVYVLLLAAAIVSFSPRMLGWSWWERFPPTSRPTRPAGTFPQPFRAGGPSSAQQVAVLALAAGLVVGGFAAPAYANHEPGGHEHQGHDHTPTGPSITPSNRATLTAVPPRPVVDPERLIDLAALIAATPDGGTVLLPYGAYRGNVIVDRPMTIQGHGWPVIVGDRTGTVLTIAASDVVVRGIQVTGSGPGPSDQPAGVRVTGDNVTLEQVVVDDSYMGVAIDQASRVRVFDSLIIGRVHHVVGDDGHAIGSGHDASGGRGDGISLWNVNGATIRGTMVTGARDAIYISFGEGILIDSNHLTDSRYGVHTMYGSELVLIENLIDYNLSALVLMYGGDVDVLRNRLHANQSPSTGFGVLIKDVTDVEIVQNVMTGNRVGIHLDGPAGGTEPIRVTANTVANNDYGVMLFPSAQAVLMANSFVDNLAQVSRAGRSPVDNVVWSDRGWGNFWSTYHGYDNGLGKGTAPHVEGSATHRILSRAPLLTAIASTPAMRLVQVMEGRWMETRPTAIDEIPLTQPVSPALPVRPSNPVAGMAFGLIGVLLASASAGLLVTMSRRQVSYG